MSPLQLTFKWIFTLGIYCIFIKTPPLIFPSWYLFQKDRKLNNFKLSNFWRPQSPYFYTMDPKGWQEFWAPRVLEDQSFLAGFPFFFFPFYVCSFFRTNWLQNIYFTVGEFLFEKETNNGDAKCENDISMKCQNDISRQNLELSNFSGVF